MQTHNLYRVPYHSGNVSGKNFLITGGAGFIGSNIVEYLLKYNAGHVRVFDNLSTGYVENIRDFQASSNFEFIEGDIRDIEACKTAVKDIDFVSHQAALGSVPRSIGDPVTTNEVNIGGFVNLFTAIKNEEKIKRVVYASSSSVYGDGKELPKVEGREGKVLSPYAVTKAVNEMYAEVYSKVYGMHSIGLRYFNIFGPRQNADNAYAAVIAKFCKAFIEGVPVTINGDGMTSRDFTFVENAVQANIKALTIEELNQHEVFNVACGDQVTLNEMTALLSSISGKSIAANYEKERVGDVRHSKANIDKIANQLGYEPAIRFQDGLGIVYQWYKEQILKNE